MVLTPPLLQTSSALSTSENAEMTFIDKLDFQENHLSVVQELLKDKRVDPSVINK